MWFRYPKLVDCTIGTNAPLPDSQPVDLMVQQVLDVLPAHALSCVTDTILTSVIFPRATTPLGCLSSVSATPTWDGRASLPSPARPANQVYGMDSKVPRGSRH